MEPRSLCEPKGSFPVFFPVTFPQIPEAALLWLSETFAQTTEPLPV